MSAQLILVANASIARCFIRHSPTDSLDPWATLVHMETRHGGRHPHQSFARDVAERLEAGLAADQFQTLWVFAANPFLAELKAQLDDAAVRHVQLWLASDLTALGPEDIEQHLKDPRLGTR